MYKLWNILNELDGNKLHIKNLSIMIEIHLWDGGLNMMD